MTNTTKTLWTVDGVSLQTYAWNIDTLGEDRQAPPPVRGGDIVVPYMPGEVWIPREVGSRTITLGMWVQGSNPDGTIPTNEAARIVWERNWHKLRALLWKPRRQMVVTKQFWVPTADLVAAGANTTGLPVLGSLTLYSASARATYAGGLAPLMQGSAHSSFTVDLKLTDPFFYSAPIEVAFDGDLAIGQEKDVLILGHDRTHNIELEYVGPLTSPMVENLSATDHEGEPLALWSRYATDIPAAERAEVRVKKFSATQYPIGDPFKTSGYVLHGGDKLWLWIEPGMAKLKFSAQAGTGVGKLSYQPAWI